MGIDDIKPAGGYRPFDDPSPESAAAPKRNGSFTDARSVLREGAANAAAPSLSVVSQFRRAELQDSAKVDQMVRAAASELVNSQDSSIPLSAADKQHLTDFLSQDPAFRQRIETYLRKVLA